MFDLCVTTRPRPPAITCKLCFCLLPLILSEMSTARNFGVANDSSCVTVTFSPLSGQTFSVDCLAAVWLYPIDHIDVGFPGFLFKIYLLTRVTMVLAVQVEGELSDICNDILKILDTVLIPNSTEGEAQVFYYKMKGDYYRYIAEFLSSDQRYEAGSNSLSAYQSATDLAAKSLGPTNPIRLGLALNFSV